MVRIAGWVFVVCTLASALGVFLPAVGARVAGPLATRASLSLYDAMTTRDVVRKLVVAYNGSSGKRVGGTIVALLGPHTGGRLKEYVDDAHDAMDAVGGVSEDDARTIGSVLALGVWTFLLLHLVMAGVVVREVVDARGRRRRMIAVATIAVLVTAAAIAIHLGCREAVWQANDELGHDPLVLGAGVYVIPAASITGLVAAIVALVTRLRQPAAC